MKPFPHQSGPFSAKDANELPTRLHVIRQPLHKKITRFVEMAGGKKVSDVCFVEEFISKQENEVLLIKTQRDQI